ncbi:hypothetical protein M8C13_08060 [Crossiella sp. SN42]|uniref:hypothetical protein n=1 Tax=Crossiella sp. SN42 TaxID=2944808 RepID=UPI00207CFFB9|nr:hypothetical protein [Crossiella sp. SN42]MCO1575713.1 hypothetical protein [Crossiella sp. SN42]
MTWVMLRDFSWTVDPSQTGIARLSAELTPRTRRLDINLARLVEINTLATPCPARFESHFPEARILLSYLDTPENGPLRLKPDVVRTSSHHLRHFVVESLGMAMLTAAVEASSRWHRSGSLHHLDALPIGPDKSYRKRGIKPDLLFGWPKKQLAGEARGRYRKAPSKALAENLRRLNELLTWSEYHRDHPFVMSWAYASEHGVTVDLFAPRRKPSRPASPPGKTSREARGSSVERAARSFTYQRLEVPAWLTERDNRATLDDWTSVHQLAERAQAHRHTVQETLFASAPPVEDHLVSGRRLHGAWAPLNLFGQDDRRLSFGVLDEALSPEEQGVTLRRLRRRAAEYPGTSVHIAGRLVILVSSNTRGGPWDLLADRG